jgi:tetratricopeptide (TPR) repeat protein
VIKKENLDLFLVQLFGWPELEPDEYQTLSRVLAGEAERVYLTGPGSALKPYLVGACLPGITIGVYGQEDPARKACDSLASLGVATALLGKEASSGDVERILTSLADGSANVLLVPDFMIADADLVARLTGLTARTGYNFVLVHDLLVGEGGEEAADAILQALKSLFPPETGARLAKVVTGTAGADGASPAFPVVQRPRIGLSPTALTEEERDELMRPIPKPLPPLPAQAFEPEVDEEMFLPTQIRTVSDEERAALAEAEERARLAEEEPDLAGIGGGAAADRAGAGSRSAASGAESPGDEPFLDEGAYLSTLEGALEPGSGDGAGVDYSQDVDLAASVDEMGVDLEQLLGTVEKPAARSATPSDRTAAVTAGLPAGGNAPPRPIPDSSSDPRAATAPLEPADVSARGFAGSDEELVSLEDLGGDALEAFAPGAPGVRGGAVREPRIPAAPAPAPAAAATTSAGGPAGKASAKVMPELFVQRKPPPAKAASAPAKPPEPRAPEVDALAEFLTAQDKQKTEDHELDELLGIGRGPAEPPATDEQTLARLQELLGAAGASGAAPDANGGDPGIGPAVPVEAAAEVPVDDSLGAAIASAGSVGAPASAQDEALSSLEDLLEAPIDEAPPGSDLETGVGALDAASAPDAFPVDGEIPLEALLEEPAAEPALDGLFEAPVAGDEPPAAAAADAGASLEDLLSSAPDVVDDGSGAPVEVGGPSGDDLMMPVLEPGTDDDTDAPTIASEPGRRRVAADDDFEAEIMAALGKSDGAEPTPVAASTPAEAEPAPVAPVEDVLTRDLMAELEEMTRSDQPRYAAPVDIAPEEEPALSLDMLDDAAGQVEEVQLLEETLEPPAGPETGIGMEQPEPADQLEAPSLDDLLGGAAELAAPAVSEGTPGDGEQGLANDLAAAIDEIGLPADPDAPEGRAGEFGAGPELAPVDDLAVPPVPGLDELGSSTEDAGQILVEDVLPDDLLSVPDIPGESGGELEAVPSGPPADEDGGLPTHVGDGDAGVSPDVGALDLDEFELPPVLEEPASDARLVSTGETAAREATSGPAPMAIAAAAAITAGAVLATAAATGAATGPSCSPGDGDGNALLDDLTRLVAAEPGAPSPPPSSQPRPQPPPRPAAPPPPPRAAVCTPAPVSRAGIAGGTAVASTDTVSPPPVGHPRPVSGAPGLVAARSSRVEPSHSAPAPKVVEMTVWQQASKEALSGLSALAGLIPDIAPSLRVPSTGSLVPGSPAVSTHAAPSRRPDARAAQREAALAEIRQVSRAPDMARPSPVSEDALISNLLGTFRSDRSEHPGGGRAHPAGAPSEEGTVTIPAGTTAPVGGPGSVAAGPPPAEPAPAPAPVAGPGARSIVRLGEELEEELDRVLAPAQGAAPSSGVSREAPPASNDLVPGPSGASLEELFGPGGPEVPSELSLAPGDASRKPSSIRPAQVRGEPEPPPADVSGAPVKIDNQVSSMLKDLLNEYPEEMVLRTIPAPVSDREATGRPARPPGSTPGPGPARVPVATPAARAPESQGPTPAPAAVQQVPAEAPGARPKGAAAPEGAPPSSRSSPPGSPAGGEATREIRHLFDLSREAHVYFYELEATFQARLDYLTAIWEDPDSNVDLLAGMLPHIERTFPDDARIPFAIGMLNLLADRRVQSLTGFNRALDLMSAHQDLQGACVVLRVLHRAFPDDVGITERLVDTLEKTGKRADAARILLDLGEGSLGRDQARRAITYLERAAALDPADRDIAHAQVRAHRAIGDESKALDAANRGLNNEPDEPVLLLYKAQALARLGRSKAADICMEKAITGAAGDAAVLRLLDRELQASRDDRNARRVQELLDRSAPEGRGGAAGSVPNALEGRGGTAGAVAAVTVAPEGRSGAFGAVPVAPEGRGGTAGAVGAVTVAPEGRSGAFGAVPVATEGRRGAFGAVGDTMEDLLTRMRVQFPRIAGDVKALQAMESDLRLRGGEERLEDRQVVELLRRFQTVGDKIKAQAPDEARRVYRLGMTYLSRFRDPFYAAVWKDDFEKRLRQATPQA